MQLDGQVDAISQLAEALSRLSGKPVTYDALSSEAFIDSRISAGWPPAAARFVEAWFFAIRNGSFDEPSPTLAALLNRPPKGLDSILNDAFFS